MIKNRIIYFLGICFIIDSRITFTYFVPDFYILNVNSIQNSDHNDYQYSLNHFSPI